MSSKLTLVVVLALACSAFAKECGVKPNQRIVNGDDAFENEFPWQVSWRFFNQTTSTHRHVCGGSIIADQWILTAAHCVDLFQDVNKIKEADFRAMVGAHSQSTPSANQKIIEVEKIHVHPQWNRNELINDIALAKLKQPIGLESGNLNAICLGRTTDDVEGSNAVMSGWGLTQHGGSQLPDILQKATVPVELQSTCKRTYFFIKNLSDGEVCAGKNPGACNGDSGGPLQYERDGKWYLLGAASWVVKCGHSTYPTVYTRVPHFLSFIETTSGITPP